MNTDRSITRARRPVVPTLLGLVAAALLASTPGSAKAQEYDTWRDAEYEEEDQNQPGLEITGYVGVMTPLASLATLAAQGETPVQADSLRADFSTKGAFSLGLDYWFSSGFGIGAFGGYTRPDLTITEAATAGTFPTEWNLGPVDYWYGVLTAMYRPNLSGNMAILRPYFLLGGGIRSLGSATLELPAQEREFTVEGSTKPVFAFGGGAHLIISGPWFLRLDVRDLVSSFDSELFPDGKTQHDLFTSVGIGYAFH